MGGRLGPETMQWNAEGIWYSCGDSVSEDRNGANGVTVNGQRRVGSDWPMVDHEVVGHGQ
jgi:ribose 1,5-bisphosphokinase PhnN